MTRNVVITGGTGGLGTALVRRLQKKDYRLAITYLLPAEAEQFEKEFDTDGDNIMLVRVDATNPDQVNSFFATVVEGFGSIHGVCALVGGWAGGRDIEETDDVRFERMLDLNLRSTFYTARAALPHLKAADMGRLVLVGSRAAIENPEGQGAFNIAKAGVVAMGLTMAEELEGTNVTSNVLMPSVIDTPATRQSFPYADYVNWPTPDEIAAVIEFILEEGSGVMNGALVPVYGKT